LVPELIQSYVISLPFINALYNAYPPPSSLRSLSPFVDLVCPLPLPLSFALPPTSHRTLWRRTRHYRHHMPSWPILRVAPCPAPPAAGQLQDLAGGEEEAKKRDRIEEWGGVALPSPTVGAHATFRRAPSHVVVEDSQEEPRGVGEWKSREE
jgi:hypothetical protein